MKADSDKLKEYFQQECCAGNVVLRKTNRGFVRGVFLDHYNQCCSIQESSNAEASCIWFGVDYGWEGEEKHNRMHLSQEQVKKMLPLLQHFAKTGLLPEESQADEAVPKLTRLHLPKFWVNPDEMLLLVNARAARGGEE